MKYLLILVRHGKYLMLAFRKIKYSLSTANNHLYCILHEIRSLTSIFVWKSIVLNETCIDINMKSYEFTCIVHNTLTTFRQQKRCKVNTVKF